MTYAEEVRERMRKLVEPLREEEGAISARIEQMEAELGELRPIRLELRAQIRKLTGEPAVNLNGKPHGNSREAKRGSSNTRFGERTLRNVLAWMESNAHAYPDGFVASHLANEPAFPIKGGQSQISKMFRVLHERGLIVLDGVRGSGGAKHYKLPPEPRNAGAS